jgi:hypothetical protein
LLTPETGYQTLSLAQGRPSHPGEQGAVTVRWPLLEAGAWRELLAQLEDGRQRVPQGQDYWDRFQAALGPVAKRFADPTDPLPGLALNALPAFTGYSEAMIQVVVGALGMWALDLFPAAFRLAPSLKAVHTWLPMGPLPGRMRFYDDRRWSAAVARWPGQGGRSLFGPLSSPDLVVGYGAGNVPGTALLIALLAQATTLTGGLAPASISAGI